jgi:glycosyltransferase involved in cell wall biosynthesis
MKKSIELSVIIAVSETQKYDNIQQLHQVYRSYIEEVVDDFEFIYVTDGDSPKVLRELTELCDSDETVKIVKLGRWFGFATALNVGFENSSGKVILTLPAYQQINSYDIPKVIKELHGSDMVVARRTRNMDTNVHQVQSKLFHNIVKSIVGIEFHDLGCKVRVFNRSVLENVYIYGDQFRFLPLLALNYGFKVKEIQVDQYKSDVLHSIYSFGHYLRRIVDLISVFFLIKFTKKPLRFFGAPGIILFIAGLLMGVILFLERIVFDVPLSDRPLLLASLFLIVFGVQLFAIGLVAEIIIFTHSKDTKEYIIEKVINGSGSHFEEETIEIR